MFAFSSFFLADPCVLCTSSSNDRPKEAVGTISFNANINMALEGSKKYSIYIKYRYIRMVRLIAA